MATRPPLISQRKCRIPKVQWWDSLSASDPLLQRLRQTLVFLDRVVELRRDAKHAFAGMWPWHDRHLDLLLEQQGVLQRVAVERGGRHGVAVGQRNGGHGAEHLVGRTVRNAEGVAKDAAGLPRQGVTAPPDCGPSSLDQAG